MIVPMSHCSYTAAASFSSFRPAMRERESRHDPSLRRVFGILLLQGPPLPFAVSCVSRI